MHRFGSDGGYNSNTNYMSIKEPHQINPLNELNVKRIRTEVDIIANQDYEEEISSENSEEFMKSLGFKDPFHKHLHNSENHV